MGGVSDGYQMGVILRKNDGNLTKSVAGRDRSRFICGGKVTKKLQMNKDSQPEKL